MFFSRLQARCVAQGIKLTPLLDELGISRGSIGRWRAGTVPNGETLLKLAARLDCSVDYLLGNDGQKEKPAPTNEDGRDDDTLEKEFMRWFQMQSPERKKEVLFDLAKAVTGHDE